MFSFHGLVPVRGPFQLGTYKNAIFWYLETGTVAHWWDTKMENLLPNLSYYSVHF